MRGTLPERAAGAETAHRRWAWLVAVLVGVLAFALVSAVIGALTENGPRTWRISVLAQKLDHLRRHAADYDTLFLGSSRVHYGVDPALFDAEMARQGCRARSFNMGVQALTLSEEHRLVQELARIGRWDRVVLERNPIPLRSLDLVGTDRGTFGFGTLTGVRLALLDLWTSPGNLLERLWGMAEVVLVGAYEQLGIGRIARLVERPGNAELPTDDRVVAMDRAGFVPIEAEVDPVMRARVAAIDRERLYDFVRQTRELAGPPPRLGERRAALLREQIEHARSIAAGVAYVVWPHSRPQWAQDARAIGQAAAEGRLGTVSFINLGDPAAVPELFAPELWHDNLHLYSVGTEIVTRAIATQLCAAERASESAAPPHDALAAAPS